MIHVINCIGKSNIVCYLYCYRSNNTELYGETAFNASLFSEELDPLVDYAPFVAF